MKDKTKFGCYNKVTPSYVPKNCNDRTWFLPAHKFRVTAPGRIPYSLQRPSCLNLYRVNENWNHSISGKKSIRTIDNAMWWGSVFTLVYTLSLKTYLRANSLSVQSLSNEPVLTSERTTNAFISGVRTPHTTSRYLCSINIKLRTFLEALHDECFLFPH